MTRLLTEPHGRIGLLGGTFDPPHWGHIKTASSAADELNLGQLAFLPSPHPPHKSDKSYSTYHLRREMVELCLALDDRFRICLIEEGNLPGTTLETILRLREEGFTEDRCHLVWLIGSDSLLDLPNWHSPDDLLDAVEIAVLPRSGYPSDQVETRFFERVRILNTPFVDISATDLRNKRRSLEDAIPEVVMEFIRMHGLYGL
jgi:nicotinate-nucleotide adenylyltransferase